MCLEVSRFRKEKTSLLSVEAALDHHKCVNGKRLPMPFQKLN